jgi:hypothetical protein
MGPAMPDSGAISANTCAFSGGKSGTLSCTLTAATWTQSDGKTHVQIASASAASPTISVQFTLPSVPSVMTFTGGMSGTDCAINLQAVDGNWTADTTQSLGSCALEIDNIHPLSADATQRKYDLVGSFTSSLRAHDGVSPAITLNGAFQ